MATVAAPGSGKTPAEMAANGPLLTLQREAKQEFDFALAQYDSELAEWESLPKADRGVKPSRPVMEHFLTSDATIEALAHIVAVSPGVSLQRDELVGWVTSFDAYKKGGERQSHLSLWAGAPLKVDRRNADPLFVESPVVCVSGGVQPDMLSALAAEAGRRDGFLERFLWSVPITTPARWTDDEIPAVLTTRVTEIFRQLRNGPQVWLILHPEARPVWREWYDENAVATSQATGMLSGAYSKLPNQVARLALVLHCLSQSPADRVSRETIENAIELGEYFRTHAAIAFGLISEVSGIGSAGLKMRTRRILERAGGEWVQKREILRGLGAHTPAADVDRVLAELEAEGVAEQERGEVGRKAAVLPRIGERLPATEPTLRLYPAKTGR